MKTQPAPSVEGSEKQNKLVRFMPHTRKSKIIAASAAVIILLGGLIWWHEATKEKPVMQPASAVSAQFKQQLPDLKKKSDQNPKDAEAHKNYAVALYATGDPGAAADQYEQAVKINPKDAVAYNNLGNTYRDLHKITKAVEAYQQSIKLNSKSLNTYANLANIQLYSQNDANAAIQTYQDGLKALPGNTQLELLLGLAYEANGDNAKAKQTYQDILAHDSGNAAAQANLDRLNGK